MTPPLTVTPPTVAEVGMFNVPLVITPPATTLMTAPPLIVVDPVTLNPPAEILKMGAGVVPVPKLIVNAGMLAGVIGAL